jgi:hypothetical protein
VQLVNRPWGRRELAGNCREAGSQPGYRKGAREGLGRRGSLGLSLGTVRSTEDS